MKWLNERNEGETVRTGITWINNTAILEAMLLVNLGDFSCAVFVIWYRKGRLIPGLQVYNRVKSDANNMAWQKKEAPQFDSFLSKQYSFSAPFFKRLAR